MRTKSNLVARTRFQYDQLNRLSSLEHGSATNARDLAFYDYQYDPASRIASIADIDGRTNYAYDKRDQLVGADRAASDTRGDESYNYDANGNRVSSSLHGNGYVTGPGNRLLSDGTYNYQYDQEGNMIRRTAIATGEYRTFAFDHRNRLVDVSDFTQAGVLKQIVQTTYDVFGRRISKTVDLDGVGTVTRPETTHFVYDGEHVILDFLDADASGTSSQPVVTFRYLFGPGIDQILSQESAGNSEVKWMLTDHLGSLRDVIDNDATILNRIQYDSFGNLSVQANPPASLRYLYAGREFDPEIELNHYRSRQFSSSIGRFTSEDTIGYGAGTLNLYAYVENSVTSENDPFGFGPRNFFDPDGRIDMARRKPKCAEESSDEPPGWCEKLAQGLPFGPVFIGGIGFVSSDKARERLANCVEPPFTPIENPGEIRRPLSPPGGWPSGDLSNFPSPPTPAPTSTPTPGPSPTPRPPFSDAISDIWKNRPR